jgi:hypothetical protein
VNDTTRLLTVKELADLLGIHDAYVLAAGGPCEVGAGLFSEAASHRAEDGPLAPVGRGGVPGCTGGQGRPVSYSIDIRQIRTCSDRKPKARDY